MRPDLNRSRADCQVAFACARVGLGGEALHHAARGFFRTCEHEVAKWEQAFAHLAVSAAAHAADVSGVHRDHYDRAVEVWAQLSSENKTLFDVSLAVVSKPHA